jgi:nitroreductase
VQSSDNWKTWNANAVTLILRFTQYNCYNLNEINTEEIIMETMDNLFCRRSIRKYTGEKISQDDLQTILRVTDTSPVAKARYDDLHLTIIDNIEFINAISANASKVLGIPNVNPLYGAPNLIVVSAINPDATELTNVQYSNAAMLVHTMTLAAVELGVGHCDIWGSIRVMNDELIGKLRLPEGFKPCCGIILGKSDVKYTKRNFPTERISRNFIK